jgi:hypothetical protein
MKGAPLPPGTVSSPAIHKVIEPATAAAGGTAFFPPSATSPSPSGSPATLTYVLQEISPPGCGTYWNESAQLADDEMANHRNVSLLSAAFGSDALAQQSFNQPIGTSTARRIQFLLDYEF